MRPAALTLSLVALFTALAAPALEASFFTPSSGPLTILTGEKLTIKVKGTQKCKFKVLVLNTNGEVAEVSFSESSKTSHKVTIEGLLPGTTQISIITEEGSISQCTGRSASYEVTVEADPDAFFDQADEKLKEAKAEAKDVVEEFVEAAVGGLAELADLVKEGEVDPIDAYFQAADVMQDLFDDLHGGMNPFLDDVYDDIWDRAADFGLDEMSPELLGYLPGACGEWDEFETDVVALVDKASGLMTKAFKKFVGQLVKLSDEDAVLFALFTSPDLFVGVSETVPAPAPEPLSPPDPPKIPLVKTWTAAGRLSNSSTGRLHVGGGADPSRGNVAVGIAGPGGFADGESAPVGEDDSWRAEFFNLPPGSYVVTLTQTDNGPVSFTVTVP